MKLFNYIFMTSLITASFVTFASPLDRINRESPVCMGKSYSPDHLRAHPLQTVRSITMQLFEQPDQKDNTVYLNMQIEAGHGTYDAFMICDRNRDGLACAVECDGGGADVVRIGKSEQTVQFVNKGFLMSGGCGGGEEQKDVWLDPAPGGDDVFDLDAQETCQ